MERSWQDVQNEIINRAHMLFAEVMRIRDTLPSKELAKIMYSKEGEEHHTTTLCRYYLEDGLSPDIITATQPIQVNGLCGGQNHSWFEIRPDAAARKHTGFNKLQPDWKYIIDVHFADVLPPILLISPLSPLQYLYSA